MRANNYYIALGGQALEACQEWQRQAAACWEARRDLVKSLGAAGLFCGFSVMGVAFDSDPGKGWLRVRIDHEPPVYKPDRRTKIGKKVAAQMNDIPGFPHTLTFSQLLGVDGTLFDDDIVFPTFRVFGEGDEKTFVIVIARPDHGTSKIPPDQIEQISTDQYQLLKAKDTLRRANDQDA